MSRNTREKSSAIAYDGRGLLYISGGITNAAATARSGEFYIPWDATIVDFRYTITTAFTHASSTFSFGLVSNTDSILDDFVTYNIGAVSGGFIGNALLLSTTVAAGAYIFETAAADTTGHIAFFMALEPQ